MEKSLYEQINNPSHANVMSTNQEQSQGPNVDQQRSDEHYYTSGFYTDQTIFPTTGAFTHLPLRKTISGHQAREHPNANLIFLRALPGHCYTLPAVPLNFTIVDIIVLLPNWFKNTSICARFINNELTAAIHVMILEEHRQLNLADVKAEEKAKKTTADEYRRVMRKITPSWTKVKHVAPNAWDCNWIAMGGFVLDDARLKSYRRPASIPFRDLAIGVKKLPEGTYAGDLTRALNYALEYPQQEYLFPEDLPTILDHIGRTKITVAHTDVRIVRYYADIKQQQDYQKKYPPQFRAPQPSLNEVVAQTQAYQGPAHKDQVLQPAMQSPYQDGQSAMVVPTESRDQASQSHPSGPRMTMIQTVRGTTQPLGREITPSQGLATHERSRPASNSRPEKLRLLLPKITVDLTQSDGIKHSHNQYEYESGQEMDALLGPHLEQKEDHMPELPLGPYYASHHLLRDCVEGNIGFDGTPFAHAARYAQQADQVGTDWYVENAPMLAELLDIAQIDRDGL